MKWLTLIIPLLATPCWAQYVNNPAQSVQLGGSASHGGGGGVATSLTTYAYAALPVSCSANQIAYCSDCKSVADGVMASSQVIGSGNGAIVICKSGNLWYIAP